VKLNTTMSTLTRNVGRSWAHSNNVVAPTATAENAATRFDMRFT
jgi:hypothetical protein